MSTPVAVAKANKFAALSFLSDTSLVVKTNTFKSSTCIAPFLERTEVPIDHSQAIPDRAAVLSPSLKSFVPDKSFIFNTPDSAN